MVFIKKVINADPGTADLVGGNDWDKLDDFHDDIDITPAVGKFNTETRWRSGKRKLMNPANTFAYTEIASAIVANVNTTHPLLSTDDEFVYKNHPVTLNSKTLSNSCIVPFITQDLNLTGDITPSQITSNQNNYSPTGLATATRLRLSTDASRNITGLALGADGRVNIIDNVGAQNIVLTNQDAASTDINRFLLGSNLTIPADKSVTLVYDSTTLRWRLASSSFAVIDNNSITHAKYQDIATDRLLGRDTAATGDPEELTVTGGLEFSGSGGIQRSALTGDVTASAASNSTTIANDAVSYAKMQNVSAASKLLGRGDSGSGDPQELTLGTGLSMSGTTLNSSVGTDTYKPAFGGRKSGRYLGGGTDINADGILNGHFVAVEAAGAPLLPSSGFLYSGRQWTYASSTTGVGVRGVSNIFSLRQNPYIEIWYQVDSANQTDLRIFIGLFADTAESLEASDVLSSDIGIGIHKVSTDNLLSFCRNDGDSTTDLTTVLNPNDTNVHRLRINGVASTPKWQMSFDGAAYTDFTTEIPALDDALNLCISSSRNNSTSTTLKILNVYCEIDAGAQPF